MAEVIELIEMIELTELIGLIKPAACLSVGRAGRLISLFTVFLSGNDYYSAFPFFPIS